MDCLVHPDIFVHFLHDLFIAPLLKMSLLYNAHIAIIDDRTHKGLCEVGHRVLSVYSCSPTLLVGIIMFLPLSCPALLFRRSKTCKCLRL